MKPTHKLRMKIWRWAVRRRMQWNKLRGRSGTPEKPEIYVMPTDIWEDMITKVFDNKEDV